MKKICLILLCSLWAYANEYYAKLEPIESYVIKAAAAGEVIFSNEAIEGKIAQNSVIIEIQSDVDKIDLKQTKAKLSFFEKMIDIEQKNYERLKKVTTRSDFDKDSQLLKALNLQSTKTDLVIKIAQLEETIKNKKLKENNRYISAIHVKKGDYVTPGTPLYDTKDLSKGKLELFIPIQQAQSIQTQTIYLDDEKTDLKINKLYKVADETHISSYKAEIIIPKPTRFSKLYKVEFK
jgi:hypothetical protein